MEAQQTRRCGSGSGGTEYEIDLTTNASAFRQQLAPTSNMPTRLNEDNDAGRCGPQQAGSAAKTSGRWRKAGASQSAIAGVYRRALSSSTKPPRQERDASLNHGRPGPIPLRWPLPPDGQSTVCGWTRPPA